MDDTLEEARKGLLSQTNQLTNQSKHSTMPDVVNESET